MNKKYISHQLFKATLVIESVTERTDAGDKYTYILLKAIEEKLELLIELKKDINSNEGSEFNAAMAFNEDGTGFALGDGPYYYKLRFITFKDHPIFD